MHPRKSSACFPVDTQLLKLMPRAGASLRHCDLHPLTLRCDPDGYYVEQHLDHSSEDPSEVSLTRRIWLENLTDEERQRLTSAFRDIDFTSCLRSGVRKGLGEIHDRRWFRLFAGIMTFLNPRQMMIVLYLYRLAAAQKSYTVWLTANDLLQAFGYTRTKDGGFASKLRSQLHCDLVTLHRTELVYRAFHSKTSKAKIKSILTIKEAAVGNTAQPFDIFHAADYTYELADRYRITLRFCDSLKRRSNDALNFPNSLEVRQPTGSNAKNDYKTRLLIFLASRLQLNQPSNGEYLILPKHTVFRNLDLFGSNGSRNNQIFWRTVDALKAAGYLLGAQELPGKKRTNSIQFQINSEHLHRHN